MENPNLQPPIASPFGGGTPRQLPPEIPQDWKTAPKVVKGWAYPLTWLSIFVLTVLMLVSFSNGKMEDSIVGVFYGFGLGLQILLNIALRKGWRGAWVAQIILSSLGLLGFPLGTAIHGYILSHWFQPRVKAWFGRA